MCRSTDRPAAVTLCPREQWFVVTSQDITAQVVRINRTSTENVKESERAGEGTNLMRILSAPRGVTTVAGANA